jgi:BolA family transcriptional regulator, general stress-responsive regulator
VRSRILKLHQALSDAFRPTELSIMDRSAAHAGHAGARDGRSHFRIHIVGSVPGASPREQHQAVYAAVGSLLETDIHALSVKVTDPNCGPGTDL